MPALYILCHCLATVDAGNLSSRQDLTTPGIAIRLSPAILPIYHTKCVSDNEELAVFQIRGQF